MKEPLEPTHSAHDRESPDDAATAVGRGYLRIEELAAHTGFSVSTLRRLWRERRITGFQPGGPRTRVVFPPNAIEQALKAAQPSPADVPATPTESPQRGPRPKWLDGSR